MEGCRIVIELATEQWDQFLVRTGAVIRENDFTISVSSQWIESEVR